VGPGVVGDGAVSAAGSITLALGLMLGFLVALVVGGFVGWQWWRDREARRRVERLKGQAEVYACLGGKRDTRPRGSGREEKRQEGTPIIIVGGGSGSDWRWG